jgi:hypothetical protein
MYCRYNNRICDGTYAKETYKIHRKEKVKTSSGEKIHPVLVSIVFVCLTIDYRLLHPSTNKLKISFVKNLYMMDL